MNALPPPVIEQRVECSVAAAIKFNVPANVLLAVAEVEGGRPGLATPNTNGTRDIGYMQFNTSYLATLASYGIKAADVAGADCYPFELAAWRLAGHFARDSGDPWTRAANYHSRTPHYNAIYRRKLKAAASRWEAWLRERFDLREVAVK
jgi:hypothetical protein